jgi:hypothetical protein
MNSHSGMRVADDDVYAIYSPLETKFKVEGLGFSVGM